MVSFPEGYRIEPLDDHHDRKAFTSGRAEVDAWLRRGARQAQRKHLSSTHLLLDESNAIAGYYTLAIGAIDFSDLPAEQTKRLPKHLLPAITLAWLGLRTDLQGRGLGERLLAAALDHCRRVHDAVEFVAFVIEALDESTRAFYERYDFRPMPGHPLKLFLSAALLDAMGSPHPAKR